MVSVYTLKRKEPRVALVTHVTVTIPNENGAGTSVDTTTLDVSPHGASVRFEAPIALGSVVRFAAIRYRFATRALVRSVARNQDDGGYSIGLEYLDEVNPIVGWPTPVARPAAYKATA